MCMKIQIQISKSPKNNMTSIEDTEPTPSERSLLTEIQTAQDFALQADTIAWQISSILISAVVIAIGYFVTLDVKKIEFFVGILLINILLSFWVLFFFGQYQVRLMKLYRVREIEEKLGLKQNYYWELGRSKIDKHHGIYRTHGPGGVLLVKILFSVLSGFTIILGLLTIIFNGLTELELCYSIILLVISTIISISSLMLCLIKIKKIQIYLKSNPGR